MEPKVVVMIPCCNEAAAIAKVVSDFHRALPEAEVVVYDNASSDRSGELAAEAGAMVRRVETVGKGNVLRAMFADFDGDVCVMADGDDTYPAHEAPRLVQAVASEGYDMAVGDRLSANYFQANSRRFHNEGNRLVRALIRRLFHAEVNDVMSGYRAMSREFVKSLTLKSEGFEVETEMTIHAIRGGYKIKEIPVNYQERSGASRSKLRTFSDGWRVIRMIFTRLRE